MTLAALNNVTTANAYTDAATMSCPGATKLNITVANAAIYIQTAADTGLHSSLGSWGPELYMSPRLENKVGSFAAVRVRSAVAGVPAQVTVEAI